MKAVILLLEGQVILRNYDCFKAHGRIGGRPNFKYIMKLYSAYGITTSSFAVVTRAIIKEFFANYFLHMSDVTLTCGLIKMNIHCG